MIRQNNPSIEIIDRKRADEEKLDPRIVIYYQGRNDDPKEKDFVSADDFFKRALNICGCYFENKNYEGKLCLVRDDDYRKYEPLNCLIKNRGGESRLVQCNKDYSKNDPREGEKAFRVELHTAYTSIENGQRIKKLHCGDFASCFLYDEGEDFKIGSEEEYKYMLKKHQDSKHTKEIITCCWEHIGRIKLFSGGSNSLTRDSLRCCVNLTLAVLKAVKLEQN